VLAVQVIAQSCLVLFRDCAKRNYELEDLMQTIKMKPAKENLLKSTDEEASKGYQIDK